MIESTPREELYEGTNFIRIRVGVDVTKPCQGRRITLRSGQVSWVNFKYKRFWKPSLFGVDMGNETTFVVGQKGMQKDGKGKPKTGYTRSIIQNQTKGKGDLHLYSPKEGKNSVPLKRSFGEIEGESGEIDCSKKQRGVDYKDLTVEAGSQLRRQQ